MNDTPAQQLTRKNLHQLWWLRNIAISSEAAILAVATFVLHLPLPVFPLLAIIAGQMVVNTVAWWRLHLPKPIHGFWVLFPLLVDMTALFGLLSLSGGASNPFTTLFILQVILAATLLSARQTWLVTFAAIGYYTLLVVFWTDDASMKAHHGGHHGHGAAGAAFDMHVYGMWGSFVLLSLLVAWFVTLLQATIHRQNQLLASSEQLALLGGIATSAAHELGTPLSSISLLAESIGEDSPQEDKRFGLLKSQIARCKDIIGQMALNAGAMRAESGQLRPVGEWLEELTTEWRTRHAGTPLTLSLTPDAQCLPIISEYALGQTILNLLDNAADSSPSGVRLEAKLIHRHLHLSVHDDGKGFPASLLEKDALSHPPGSSKAGGMGMGLYLARMVVERLEGSIRLENRAGGGATVTLTLPFARICA